jgi:(p)ppGpp synthase/HD superfamily hydrolase
MAILSYKFDEALQFAVDLHREQTRKDTEIPYVGHLLSVAGLVLENNGSETQAIAALLHDAIEDQAEKFGGAERLGTEIERRFGIDVCRIVEACTDARQNPKPEWRPRKERYIRHVEDMAPDAALVSLADKVHNARAIVSDLRRIGTKVFERFTGQQDGTLWYYRELARAFTDSHRQPLADELSRVVAEMAALAEERS